MSAIPADVPDLARFAADVAARVAGGVWAPATGERCGASLRRARAGTARRDGRDRGLLRRARPAVADREATRVALRPLAANGASRIVSIGADGHERRCDVPLDLVADGDRAYDAARRGSRRIRHGTGRPMWRACSVLAREHAMRFERAPRVLVASDVPEGKGVSSSAALEAATMEAVIAAWSAGRSSRAIARCAVSRSRTSIVGAPCGIMDQMASVCGEPAAAGAALSAGGVPGHASRCPTALGVWGIDSGIRHAVTGADYGAVRVGAFMGYRILAELAGLRVTPGDRPDTCASTIRAGTATSPTSAATTFAPFEPRAARDARRRGVPRRVRRHDRPR